MSEARKAQTRISFRIDAIEPVKDGLVVSEGELLFFLDSVCVWRRTITSEQAGQFYRTLLGRVYPEGNRHLT